MMKLSKPGSSRGLAWPYIYYGVESWNQPEGLHRAPSNSKAQSHICAFGVMDAGVEPKNTMGWRARSIWKVSITLHRTQRLKAGHRICASKALAFGAWMRAW